MEVAGVVVLYNPDEDVVFNVNRYLEELGVLYVIDNSDIKNMELVRRLNENKKVIYKDNQGNKGIAHALNRGAFLALRKGYKWLLTMDQDSRVDTKMLSVMKRYITENDTKCIGIIAPKIVMEGESVKGCKETISYKMEAITSGSLMNLEAFKKVGRFKDELFIQYVDFEYCLRLLKHKYKIIEMGNAILYQKYGNPTKSNAILLYNYQPIRHYYRVRNGLYLCDEYEKYFPAWVKNFKSELKMRLYHDIVFEKYRLKRIFYIIRGLMDYKFRRYGKIKY